MRSLIIHGHYYQPPRENPWTGRIDPEPDAAPFHDWNERIHTECYGPNAAVRIQTANGSEQVINNYSNISFDFGPTLLSWLERQHPATYSSIIAADAESLARFKGHGNAIAQAYNHAILPLCNERDRLTQIRWGLADFRYRFRREPEAMWLPETACNDAVLDSLIDHELRFVILAPQQAARIRDSRQASASWQEISKNSIDPSIPYLRYHRNVSGKSLAVFFYDADIAHAIAFEQALSLSAALAERIAGRPGAGEMVNVATDGESYGHHHKFGDLGLAHLLKTDAPARGFKVTNYGEYLDQHPPSVEVEIDNGPAGEGSSWSCIHGVARWTSDCGCHTGGEENWNQAWRKPLRGALDFLRDEAAAAFEATRGGLFIDPWAARDESIKLILDQLESREMFLSQHAPRQLNREQERKALGFLEMQRNALLMYTSCAWFFNDIGGIEPVQILKYACRVIELLRDLELPSPRQRFLEILAEAKSNRPELGNGADIYRRLVEPSNPLFDGTRDPLARVTA
jgi:alpha-amylase/alpha-mannosidase (GH57 family)